MPKVINSPIDHDIEIGFQGTNYIIPPKKDVLIEDETAVAFLVERFPWLAVSEPKRDKEPYFIAKVKTEKTPVYANAPAKGDMVITPRSTTDAVDELPSSGTIDRDGVEWVGEGVQRDVP
jgi:hypothetical protein